MARKIKDTSEVLGRIDVEKVAQALGSRIISIPELSREETENGEYLELGLPVPISAAEKSNIYYYGSRMLNQYGKSLDDVIGYRILEQDEEQKFREECAKQYHQCPLIVRYYGKKQKTA